MTQEQVAVGDILVHCLRQAGAAEASASLRQALRGVVPMSLVEAAEHHGVAPAVYRILGGSPELPGEVLAGLEAAYRRQWQVNLRILADLTELVPVFDGLGVRWVVVKGPVLAQAIYDGHITRSYIDLDVVVHRVDLPAVLDALESSGAWLRDRNWTLIRSGMRGELTLGLPHGSALDLHWHLFNEPRVRRAFSVPIGELLARSRRVSVNGISTPTFDPADTLIHIAAHASLAGGYRLVWFKDLEQVIAHDSPDWDDVVQRSRAYGAALMVATMLERSRQLLDADVPSEVLDALAPGHGWRAVVGLAGRLSPTERSFGRQLTARTLVSSTRRSGPASAVALIRSVAVDVMKPLLTEPAHPWRRGILGARAPSSAPNPLTRPSGEDIDRSAFLRHVSQAPVDP